MLLLKQIQLMLRIKQKVVDTDANAVAANTATVGFTDESRCSKCGC